MTPARQESGTSGVDFSVKRVKRVKRVNAGQLGGVTRSAAAVNTAFCPPDFNPQVHPALVAETAGDNPLRASHGLRVAVGAAAGGHLGPACGGGGLMAVRPFAP